MAKSRKSAKAASGSNELVTWALHGLEQLIENTRQRLQELEAHARKLRGAGKAAASSAPAAEATTAGAPKARKKRKLRADARRRIAEAQKRRWAKVRAAKAKA